MGQPPFSPTEEQRRTVRTLAGFGVQQEAIANHLEVDAKTLRKSCRRELDGGMLEANTRVAQSLFNMATQGGNVAAAIFWLKARSGWREKNDLGTDGNPQEPLTVIIRTGVPRNHDADRSTRMIEGDQE